MDFKLNLDFGNSLKVKKTTPLSLTEVYDVLIIGGGPAGLNAALYAKRKGLSVGLISKKTGGLVMDTSTVENYLGYSLLRGEDLVNKFLEHVQTLDIPILEDVDVTQLNTLALGLHEVSLTNGNCYKTKTVLIATGSKPKKLLVIGEDEFANKGVSYCAICDGPLYRGKNVVVAGGGNSAVEAAIDLSKLAQSVTLVHRSKLRADSIMLEVLYKTSNITVKLETQILEIIGDTLVNGVLVKDKLTNIEEVIRTDGIFVEIGHQPNSQAFKDIVSTTEQSEIIINEKNECSTPGIFAAGDVTTIPFKQIIIAASEGAKAALSISDYLNKSL